jgi:hypothetical protein
MADSTSSTAGWGEERPSAQQVRPFDGRSFPVWKARIRAKLQATRLLYVLDEPQEADPAPNGSGGSSAGGENKKAAARSVKKQDQQEADEQRAYAMLILALDDNHVAIVTSETEEGDVRAAWKVLLRMYERETTASKHQLRGELHRIKLNAGESIDAYKARVLHLASRLRAMKEGVSEGEQIYCMLEGLPRSYDTLRQAMEVQEGLTFEQMCSHLRDAQEKLRVRAKEEQPARDLVRRLNAVTMESTCALCKTKGHWIGQCASRKGTKPGECFVCGATGHGWRACPQKAEQLNAVGSDDESEDQEDHQSSWLAQADALVKRIREEKYSSALIPSGRR